MESFDLGRRFSVPALARLQRVSENLREPRDLRLTLLEASMKVDLDPSEGR